MRFANNFRRRVMNLNKIISFGVALALMFSISACKNKDDSNKEDTPKKWESSKIIGTVGGDNIYDSEFLFYYNLNKSRMESSEGVENSKQMLVDKTLDDLVKLKILLKMAKEEGVKLDESDQLKIERNIYDFIKRKANENEEEAEKLMKETYGVSIEEYGWIYEDYIIAYEKYASNEIAKIEVSDSEIEERFERDKDEYKKVNVRHVLLYTIDVDTQQPLKEETIEQKRLLAEDIYKRAKEGESIEELAKQYSEHADLKITGGEETLGKNETVPEFENWVFNAKEGEVGLIETSYGFHIVKVIKQIEASLGDIEKSTIRSNLQNEKFEKKIEELKEKNPLVKNQDVIDSLELF